MADIDVDNLQSFTTADLLKLAEYGIAHLVAGGQSYTVRNRTFTRAQLPQLRELRNDLKREVEESGSVTGSLTALAKFGRPQ